MAVLVGTGISAAQAAQAVLSEQEAGTLAPPSEAAAPAQHPLVAGLVARALRFDTEGVARGIRESVESLDWPAALNDVLFPALEVIGDSWESGDLRPSHEHFFSEQMRAAILGAVVERLAEPGPGPLLVLACPTDERHDLGIAALWLLLLRSGLRVCYLGADVPTPDLIAAIRQLEPAAVCLAATATAARPELALAARAIASEKIPIRVVVGGPALSQDDDSRGVLGVRLPHGIDAAAAFIARELQR